MKYTYFLIPFLFTFNLGFAQSFGTKDSKWVYNYDGYWSFGIVEVKYERDTIIDNEVTSIFSKTGTFIKKTDSLKIKDNLDPIFIRSEDGIIEFSVDAITFDTLINFKAQIGQSWYIYRRYPYHPDTLKLTLKDTLTRSINGIQLFTQVVGYKFLTFPEIIDTVFEYIGTKKMYISPFDLIDRIGDGGEGGIVRCFENKLLGIVFLISNSSQLKYKYDCNNLSSVTNQDNEKQSIIIQGNVTGSFIQIENLSVKIKELEFIDFLGRIACKRKIVSGVNQVDLESLIPGVYFISSKNSILGKLVKK